jgi:hypothetical protein
VPQFVACHGATAAEHQDTRRLACASRLSPNVIECFRRSRRRTLRCRLGAAPGVRLARLPRTYRSRNQARFNELTAEGFAPTLLSAAGPVERATFTVLFERGVEFDTLTHEHRRAFDQGFIPRCLVVYGTSEDRRYAGIWVRNIGPVLFDAEVRAGIRSAWSPRPTTDGSCRSSATTRSAMVARHRLNAVQY